MAKDNKKPGFGITRREFIKTTSAAGGALALGPGLVQGGTTFAAQASAGASQPAVDGLRCEVLRDHDARGHLDAAPGPRLHEPDLVHAIDKI